MLFVYIQNYFRQTQPKRMNTIVSFCLVHSLTFQRTKTEDGK